MKKLILILLVLCSPVATFGQLTNGTTRTSVMKDASGNITSTPLVFSNQVSMVVNPTNNQDVVNLQYLTNTIFSITNASPIANTVTNVRTAVPWLSVTNAGGKSFSIITNTTPVSIPNGGTSTNTTMLVGSWTNTINFRTSGTNDANAFSLNGFVGATGTISNLSATAGVTNVMVFTNGFLHNRFTIP